MTERIELPDRTLYFTTYYAAEAWLTEHRDAFPDAVIAEWVGPDRECVFDAATGDLLGRGLACRACRGQRCPDHDWARTSAFVDFGDAARAAGVVPTPFLLAAAAELAEFLPELTGRELWAALAAEPIPPGSRTPCGRRLRRAS